MHVSRASIIDALESACDAVHQAADDLSEAEIARIEELGLRIFSEIDVARNSRAPINRLPAEILTHIFYRLLPCPADFMPQWPTSSPACWLDDIIAVCQYWRALALSTPDLWSVLLLEKWMDQVEITRQLRQSGDAPLTVFCGEKLNESQLTFMEEILQTHGHRLEQLHMRGVPLSTSTHFLPRSAPLLRSLTFCARRKVDEEEASSDWHAPQLRSVSLRQWAAWRIYSFSGLQRLALFSISSSELDGGFVEMLRACPTMEELYIFGTEWSGQGLSRAGPVVSLQRLRKFYLSLRAKDTWINELLSSMEVPEYCDFRIEMKDPTETDNSDGHEQSHMPRLPSPTTLRPLLSIDHIIVLPDVTAEFRYATNTIAIHSGTIRLRFSPQIATRGITDAGPSINSCSELTVLVPYRMGNVDSQAIWRNLLRALPAVRKITIIGDDFDTFWEALRPGAQGLGLLCPDLHTINMQGKIYEDSYPSSAFWIMVARRAHFGAQLRQAMFLSLHSYSVDHSTAQYIYWDETGLPDETIVKDDESIVHLCKKDTQAIHKKAVSPWPPAEGGNWLWV